MEDLKLPKPASETFRNRVRQATADLPQGDAWERANEEGMLAFAAYFTKHPFPERHELFQVNDSGLLIPSSNDDAPSILAWTEGTAPGGLFYAEDVRLAAAKMQEKFPEIEFTFDEDRTQKLFSYTARLTP